MLFAPAQTTATGVLASSSRSAEMSIVVSAPRCTPPTPPVANTRMPAMAAIIIVAATVVAPSAPRATSMGRSRRLALATFVPALPRYSICSSVRPAQSLPPMTAMVAGSAPFSRAVRSQRSAVSTFCGYGMPWLIIVLSSAITGRPSSSAFCTLGDICRFRFTVRSSALHEIACA